MDGVAAPSEWQGAFDFKYNINGTKYVLFSVLFLDKISLSVNSLIAQSLPLFYRTFSS